MAAQNCRKRKIDQIQQLESQVQSARQRKHMLLMERENLFRQRDEWRSKMMRLEEDILEAAERNAKDFALDLEAPEVAIVRRSQLRGRSSAAMNRDDDLRVREKVPS